MMSPRVTIPASTMVLAAIALTGCAPAIGAPKPSASAAVSIDPSNPVSTLEALQQIADANGNTRATGTPGGLATADAIVAALEGLGLQPTVEEFALLAPDGTETGERGRNIVADLNTGTSSEVVVVGAHYDSVEEGPGIVDNASGVATLLAAAAAQPDTDGWEKTIRLAFWDAEEGTRERSGLQGSTAYVGALTDEDAARISGYVNYDMTAVENPEWLLIDSDFSSASALPAEIRDDFIGSLPPVAEGATELEAAVAASVPADAPSREDITFIGSTDIWPFLQRGIASAGVSLISRDADVDENGVLEYVPCYHSACDDLENASLSVLTQVTGAAIALLPTLAR